LAAGVTGLTVVALRFAAARYRQACTMPQNHRWCGKPRHIRRDENSGGG